MKKLYIGKLAYETTEQRLRSTFEKFGPIISVNVIMDNMSGRSKGFAFVELEDDVLAQQAIAELNGSTLDGRTIVVNEAEDKGRGFNGGSGRPSGFKRSGNQGSKGPRGYSGAQRF